MMHFDVISSCTGTYFIINQGKIKQNIYKQNPLIIVNIICIFLQKDDIDGVDNSWHGLNMFQMCTRQGNYWKICYNMLANWQNI